PVWWLFAYGIFVGLNMAGVEASFRVSVSVTLLALGILLIFFVNALPRIDCGRFALNIEPQGGATPFFSRRFLRALQALPFAVWFYLGIEQLPLAAEEAHDPRRDLPRGLLLGFLTLVLCAFATLCLAACTAPGATGLASSEEPLFEALRNIF